MTVGNAGWGHSARRATLAGNLTPIGSVVNLIVFETARGKAEISFMGYRKIGVPVTTSSTIPQRKRARLLAEPLA